MSDEQTDAREANRVQDVDVAHDEALVAESSFLKMVEAAKVEPAPKEKISPADTEDVALPPPINLVENLPPIRTSGNDPVMSAEEYKKKFNAAMTEDTLTELAKLLFNMGPFKPIVEMSLDEIQDHIHLMEKFIVDFRIVKQRAVIHLEDQLEESNENERERIRKRDREYKVKANPDAPKTSKPRAAPKSKFEKQVENLMKLMKFSREKAIKFLKESGVEEE